MNTSRKDHDMTTPTISTAHIREYGHDGRCDHDDGRCPARPEWLVAEAGRADLSVDRAPVASLALYCAEHRGAAPVAEKDAVTRAADAFEGAAWPVLLAHWPDPIRLV